MTTIDLFAFTPAPSIEPSEYVAFLEASLQWGIQAGVKATAFIAGMSLLTYMFKN